MYRIRSRFAVKPCNLKEDIIASLVFGCNKSATTLSITTLSILAFSKMLNKTRHSPSIPALSIMAENCYAECRFMLSLLLSVKNKPRVLNVVMLSVVMLSIIMLSVIMLSVIMLSVVMLSVVMLSVVAPFRGDQIWPDWDTPLRSSFVTDTDQGPML